ncbi:MULTISPECIES: flavodoxin family protein [Agrobacterium]|jgi:multimeric flavodoxin WrbA|uniref:Multimeric flavodoxin WrbA n=2 Tax=Agrobacterium tumefaciens complex TaxID=1183400 RepID=A0AAW8M0W0_AGRTU|nr:MULTISPECIES: NAD(P)H-dependent oxidoreductase [Agrobacterium]MCP2137996.1 multimeric flavodoxin WrbA [Rhizobium sp. SLBN-94]EPR23245.1 multimeric flavodoxin WrbA [Agrobacterium radiobacter DSM 30147]KAB0459144.1 NAD(P)H-dependent oxidoreductase [Agrobacterium tumefaciens]KWT75342.1 flavodoxin [Agrobacterium radiobacter]MBB4409375.1 multimeric flavodoxin WrbA [Agrobacterium radiobacter]
MSLTALALNATLKSSTSAEPSSTEKILALILQELGNHDVQTEIVRLVDHDIKAGVTSNEGEGDAWPAIREKILAVDILLIGTPIWLGQPSSVCKRTLERMDAFLDETDEQGRMVSYGKVGAVAVVGNEDGAHHVSAELFQALNDVGFTVPANAVAYWVGEAMGSRNFVDLDETPDAVKTMVTMLVRNTVHLARLLKNSQYPRGES